MTKFLLGLLLLLSAHLKSQELLILGAAQDAGKPQLACAKSCCTQDSTRGLAVSLALLYKAPEWILFEASPSITEQVQQIPAEYDSLPTAVFVSHAHIGHYTGLQFFGREAANSANIPVACAPRMAQFLQSNGPWSQLCELNNIQIVPQKADSLLNFDEIAQGEFGLISFLVPHRDEFSETLGFLIAGETKTALFIPDIDKWEKWWIDIGQLLSLVDYAFIDGTFYDGKELPGRDMNEIPHPFVVESMARFDSLSAELKNKVYFIHLNHTNPLWRPESEESLEVESRGYHIARRGQRFKL